MPEYYFLFKLDITTTVFLFRYACRLLREGMKRIEITLDSPDIVSLERHGDKDAIRMVKYVKMLV